MGFGFSNLDDGFGILIFLVLNCGIYICIFGQGFRFKPPSLERLGRDGQNLNLEREHAPGSGLRV